MSKILFLIIALASLASCSVVNDCECTITDEQGNTSSNEHYDYEGPCSELSDENADCKVIL